VLERAAARLITGSVGLWLAGWLDFGAALRRAAAGRWRRRRAARAS